MPRGRVVGQRGSISRLGAQPAAQAAGAPAVGQAAAAAAHRGAATAQGAPVAAGGVRGVAPTRPSAPGTQHVKPQQNLPGELNNNKQQTKTNFNYHSLQKTTTKPKSNLLKAIKNEKYRNEQHP